jgi:hypothetical protein
VLAKMGPTRNRGKGRAGRERGGTSHGTSLAPKDTVEGNLPGENKQEENEEVGESSSVGSPSHQTVPSEEDAPTQLAQKEDTETGEVLAVSSRPPVPSKDDIADQKISSGSQSDSQLVQQFADQPKIEFSWRGTGPEEKRTSQRPFYPSSGKVIHNPPSNVLKYGKTAESEVLSNSILDSSGKVTRTHRLMKPLTLPDQLRQTRASTEQPEAAGTPEPTPANPEAGFGEILVLAAQELGTELAQLPESEHEHEFEHKLQEEVSTTVERVRERRHELMESLVEEKNTLQQQLDTCQKRNANLVEENEALVKNLEDEYKMHTEDLAAIEALERGKDEKEKYISELEKYRESEMDQECLRRLKEELEKNERLEGEIEKLKQTIEGQNDGADALVRSERSYQYIEELVREITMLKELLEQNGKELIECQNDRDSIEQKSQEQKDRIEDLETQICDLETKAQDGERKYQEIYEKYEEQKKKLYRQTTEYQKLKRLIHPTGGNSQGKSRIDFEFWDCTDL